MTTAEAARRQGLYDLLGDLPPRSRTVDVQLIAEEEREGYVLEIRVLNLNGSEPVPAYFVRPKNVQGPLPVILYNHAHGGDYVLGYAAAGAADAWRLSRYATGHMETAAMRAEIVAYVQRRL